VFVLTTGNGVDMFVLDPAIGSFISVKSQLRMPAAGKIYSVNEANRRRFRMDSAGISTGHRRRDTQAATSDRLSRTVHRTLLKGGVFSIRRRRRTLRGKLRLMYEANPIAMLIEQAGGKAITVQPRAASWTSSRRASTNAPASSSVQPTKLMRWLDTFHNLQYFVVRHLREVVVPQSNGLKRIRRRDADDVVCDLLHPIHGFWCGHGDSDDDLAGNSWRTACTAASIVESGRQAVIDQNRDVSFHRRELASAPKGTRAPVEFPAVHRGNPLDVRFGICRVSITWRLRTCTPPSATAPMASSGWNGTPSFRTRKYIERRGERGRDCRGYRHAAARQRQHQHIRSIGIRLQQTRELASGIAAIPEHRLRRRRP
jgi:hypothetical protein